MSLGHTLSEDCSAAPELLGGPQGQVTAEVPESTLV